MKKDLALVAEQLAGENPEVVAETLRNLVSKDLNARAAEVFRYCSEVQPHNYYLVIRYADILIEAGELAEAETLLDEELKKSGERFSLLLLLGRVDERRGQNISALDIYRRAALLAETDQQRQEINAAFRVIKQKVKSDIIFKNGQYIIHLQGNRSPLNLQYNLEQLKRRRDLLNALLEQVDRGAQEVLEIEADGGVIARNLAAHGFKTFGTAVDMTDIMLAIGFEYIEALRNPYLPSPDYYSLDLNEAAAGGLEEKDVIIVAPARRQWYEERSAKKVALLLEKLFERCRRQLFFYLPPAEGAAKDNLRGALLTRLKNSRKLAAQPRVCYTGADGGRLYRIDKSRSAGSGPAKVLPVGLEALDGSSEVIGVEVERCRSLNGFGFGQEGWNHFSAALQEKIANPGLSYEDSILKKFYDHFQPKNRREQLFGRGKQSLKPLDQGWTIMPWVETLNRQLNPADSPHTRHQANHHYGPNSAVFGRLVHKKLLDTYTLIRQHGYMPEIFPDGYIQGYLLKDGDDYRFYVNEGQHRMAAIGLLGYAVIKARFNPEFLPVIDIRDLFNWPQVKSGLYPKEVAEKVFYYFFEEDGRRKAEELGLL